MSEDVAEPRRIARPGRRVLRAAGILLLLLLIALALLWSQRRTIATDYLDRTFAAKGVPARYRIADLGFHRQRLIDVVIGDPARPDLVADWLEVDTRIGFGGGEVIGVRGHRLRLRATLRNGTVSLGSIDRLLPAPSGQPFALPAIDLDLADARVRLETAGGVIGLKLAGKGRLDGGFDGKVWAIADRMAAGPCRVARGVAALRVSVTARKPRIAGPIRAAAIDCGTAHARQAGADVRATLGDALDRWDGSARLAVAEMVGSGARLRDLGGSVTFTGTAAATGGAIDLTSGPAAVSQAQAGALAARGRYAVQSAGAAFDGMVRASDAALAPGLQAKLRVPAVAPGTPVAPIAAGLVQAVAGLARRSDVTAQVAIANDPRASLIVRRVAVASSAGARVTFAGGRGIEIVGAATTPSIDGTLSTAGGGLPDMRVTLRQPVASGPIAGRAVIAPYSVGGARLEVAPVRFIATPRSNTHVVTALTLSGPLGDGRVERLSLPIDALWDGSTRLVVNPDCSALTFDKVAVAGLTLDRGRIGLCPVAGALIRTAGGRIGGGATIAAPRLTGTIGGSPLRIATDRAELHLDRQRFGLSNLGVRLGEGERVSRLDFGRLEGRVDGAAIVGSYASGGGQIGAVPLILSDAGGNWRLADGRLTVGGAMRVSDAAPEPRFQPLAARDVALSLVGGRITVSALLAEPSKGVKVADVRIAHDLSGGTGHADLAVPGLTFTKDFQPDLLTKLTFGVVADVAGTVRGDGRIDWSPERVTSTGTFGTAGLDLAAAFGPVNGIATQIRFTDLLSLQSAPGQIVTIRQVNPGVIVENGTIRYQTLPASRVDVEGGRWPFAGGELRLEPTLLDFSEKQSRRMTFDVEAMDAGQFLQQFDFKNMNATGVFDGQLPIVFDAEGGRIVGGRLNVRQGGGTLAYVGEVGQKNLGFWGNMAFDALKSLKYRDLTITMNGPLSGEIITEVRFAGLAQGVGAKRNFILDRLQKLPFIFNVRIKAPFRQLIDSAASFYDPKRLIQRNLPALLEEQNKRAAPPAAGAAPKSIQPPASGTVP